MTTGVYRLQVLASLLLLPALCWPAAEDFNRQTLVRDGRQLEILVSGKFNPQLQATLVDWVQYLASDLRQVYGHWPVQHWQVSISPADGRASDPIPWAQVHRDEVERVEFFVSRGATAETLRQDWTGYHEFAHLLIPYRGWGDAWFSEGLASYYQGILQARAGLISEQQMWQKLYEGFERGLAETQFEGQPLHTVSDNMREEGGFMRVYWSGAWYFLAADTRLRMQSGGRLTLDTALTALNDCCAEQRLSVPEIVERLDRLNQVVVFGSLYREVKDATGIPPFASIFASLGIDLQDRQVVLQNTGPGARLRRDIASAR